LEGRRAQNAPQERERRLRRTWRGRHDGGVFCRRPTGFAMRRAPPAERCL